MTDQAALDLYDAANAADAAWHEAYKAICPKGTWPGDFRYTDAAKGEPGSDLRRVYDARCAAVEAWREHLFTKHA